MSKAETATECTRCSELQQQVTDLSWYVAELSWAIRKFFAAQAVEQLAPAITAKLEQEIYDKLNQGFG